MLLRFAKLIIFLFGSMAQAQWGTGIGMGNTCPYNYGAGRGAMNGMDEVSNMQGMVGLNGQRIQQKKNQIAQLDSQINRAKADMRRTLRESAIRAITEHRIYNRGPNSYQRACTGATQAEGCSSGEGRSNPNLPPTPSEFCVWGKDGCLVNRWVRDFAMADGQVNESICEFRDGNSAQLDYSAVATCRRGLREYDELLAMRVNLEQEINDLEAQSRASQRQATRVRDEMAEGTYCPTCAGQRPGYAAYNNTGNVLGLVGMLAIAGVSIINNMNQRERMMYGGPWGPRPMMMGPGPMMMGPMAFGGGFPAMPYAAPIPGYMGMGPGGVYGAVPGAIGAGGFGCQGTMPMMAGNPYAFGGNPMMGGGMGMGMMGMNPMMGGPSMFAQPNLFNNPYASPFMNPAMMQNPMLNPGFGPGFMPTLGNGVPGYGMFNPYNSMNMPMGMGAFPNSMPYVGGNPFDLNPFLQNPYFNQNFQLNPFMNGSGGWNPYMPGMNNLDPFMGMGQMPFSNYGYNPYAPVVLPFMGGGPYYGAGGMPGMGMGGGYPGGGYGAGSGLPYVNPAMNYYAQMEMLRRNLQVIQSGSAWNPNAPVVLPYPWPQQRQPYGYPPLGGPLSPGRLAPGPVGPVRPLPMPTPVQGR